MPKSWCRRGDLKSSVTAIHLLSLLVPDYTRFEHTRPVGPHLPCPRLPVLHRKFVGKMSANSRSIIRGFKALIPCPIAVAAHSGFGPLVTGYGVTKTVFKDRLHPTPPRNVTSSPHAGPFEVRRLIYWCMTRHANRSSRPWEVLRS